MEVVVADPEPARLFLADLANPAEPLALETNPPRVTAIGLDNTARGEARGMTADRATWSATLREGQRAAMSLSLASGECATFIAQGGLGVVELDLFLTVASGRSVRLLAEDRRSGSIAVIGGRGECFLNRGEAPLQADLHVKLRRGSGVVIVRTYRRAAQPASPPPR